jgi:hypothetical protein
MVVRASRFHVVLVGGITGLAPYYSVFSSRIAAYRDTPPPKDWDGVFTAHEK